jgi:hypothetical protein
MGGGATTADMKIQACCCVIGHQLSRIEPQIMAELITPKSVVPPTPAEAAADV